MPALAAFDSEDLRVGALAESVKLLRLCDVGPAAILSDSGWYPRRSGRRRKPQPRPAPQTTIAGPARARNWLSSILEPLNATISDAILRHKLRLLKSEGSDGFGSICR
jgi:hypothetical protein